MGDSLMIDLPVSVSANVKRGQKLQLRLHHDRCCGIGFIINVRGPQLHDFARLASGPFDHRSAIR